MGALIVTPPDQTHSPKITIMSNTTPEKLNLPPLSIVIFIALLALMQVAALTTRAVQEGLGADAAVNVILLLACGGVWMLRKWAVWVLLIGLIVFAVFKVAPSDAPVRDFIYTGFPFVLIAAACTLPHYKQMR